jgi:hypothetical protein
MRKYYNSPPEFIDNIPNFTKRFFYRALVWWADREYQTALIEAGKSGRMGVVRVLSNEWSGWRVLSQLDGFRMMCARLDEKTWNKLDRKTRHFITKAYNMYEDLRVTAIN